MPAAVRFVMTSTDANADARAILRAMAGIGSLRSVCEECDRVGLVDAGPQSPHISGSPDAVAHSPTQAETEGTKCKRPRLGPSRLGASDQGCRGPDRLVASLESRRCGGAGTARSARAPRTSRRSKADAVA